MLEVDALESEITTLQRCSINQVCTDPNWFNVCPIAKVLMRSVQASTLQHTSERAHILFLYILILVYSFWISRGFPIILWFYIVEMLVITLV